MYKDTITLFNRSKGENSDTWYAHILPNVDFNADRANIIRIYGEDSSDRAALHIRVKRCVCGCTQINTCGGFLPYYTPKAWEKLTEENRAKSIKLSSGKDFDFFVLGKVVDDGMAINDGDYTEGLYSFMNAEYSHCYAITNAADYSIIPHVEVTAK